MHREEGSTTSAGRPQTDHPAENNVSWRNALIPIGKYAAYVTSAMTILIRGDAALATIRAPTARATPILVWRMTQQRTA
jgi:hypothetical protein